MLIGPDKHFLREHGPISLPCSDVSGYQCSFDTQHFAPRNYAQILADGQLSERAVPKRQAEFVAGRLCVNQCFDQFSVSSIPKILRGHRGCPVWPSPFKGSISHTNGTAVAVVTQASTISSIGIDIEKTLNETATKEVGNLVLTTTDQRHYINCQKSKMSLEQYTTYLFSAKEAVYKALFPLVQHFFDFSAVSLHSINGQYMTFLTNPNELPSLPAFSPVRVWFTDRGEHCLTLCKISVELAHQIESVNWVKP